MKKKYYFECNDCGKTYEHNEVMYLCPICESKNSKNSPPKGVLKTLYFYDKIKEITKKEKLFDKLKSKDFVDLLPISSPKYLPKLKIGKTPVYKFTNFDNKEFPFVVYLKDDSQNPTFSFKDRASALVSAYAREYKIKTIVAASTGNAGSSIAGISAVQHQKAIVFVPASAPKAKLTQICMYGAQIVPVDGTYDDAFDMSIEATKEYGWYNRNTAYNPFTIEGKKIAAYEIYQQLKKDFPDRIFVPTGDGVIISGIYKGFEDLLKLDLIKKIPTIVCVQAEKSCNIINNLNEDDFVSQPSNTIADSISVDIPRNFFMIRKFLKQYNGEAVKVSDDEILEASQKLSRNTGIFSEPAASAAFAGLLKYYKENKCEPGSKNLVMLTGSGLKDLSAVQKLISIPKPVKPDLDSIKKVCN